MGFSRRRALFKSGAPGCVSPGPPVKPLKEKELGPFGELCTSNPAAEVPGVVSPRKKRPLKATRHTTVLQKVQ